MAKAYLIGGTPRTGKTTLTLRFIEHKPILGASTDAIRYTLRRVIAPEDEPDLFHLGKYTSNDPERRAELINNPQAIIDIQNKESEIVWRSVVNFIKSNLEDGFDVLIEGVAILPSLLQGADFEYKVVFLGNLSDQHVDTIINSARQNPNDWMHSLEDETIKAFAVFNQSFSQYIKNQADQYGMQYVEVRDDFFSEDIDYAFTTLLD